MTAAALLVCASLVPASAQYQHTTTSAALVTATDFGDQSLQVPGFGGELKYSYNFIFHLAFGLRVGVVTQGGESPEQTVVVPAGNTLTGRLHFDGLHLDAEAFIRWTPYSGYSLAPYIEAGGGGQGGIYRNLSLHSDSDLTLASDLEPFYELDPSVSAEVGVTCEFWDSFLVGCGVRYTVIIGGGVARSRVTVPFSFGASVF
jgi:hypothetical protein